uniref:Uncharacterized protein n=1 Tax=Anguilla anguilla TaxID=7936 RepID=A0A0E9W3Y5_ANGAN
MHAVLHGKRGKAPIPLLVWDAGETHKGGTDIEWRQYD